MAKGSRFLALDIGSSTIKLAEFARGKGGGLHLLNFHFGELGVDPSSEEDRTAVIISTIQNLLKEKKIRPSPTVVSVSGQQVFTRYTKLPPVEPDKIAEIVRYEAQQNVPIPIDELVWDYQITTPPDAPELEVALVAIKTNLVEELVNCVEAAKLRTDVVDVSPLALYNCVRYNYGDPQGCTVLADIGGRNTNLVFVEQNKLYSRSFPIGGNAITQAIAAEYEIGHAEAEAKKKEQGFIGLGAYTEPENEEQARLSQVIRSTMNRLEGELRRTIHLYRSQLGGSPPSTILLSGATSALPAIDQYFRDKYPNVTVDFFNPFKNIEISNGVSREELAKCAPFFGEVVGLGLREVAKCQMEVNLLPQSARLRHRAAARRPWYVTAAVAAVLIVAAWWGYTYRMADLYEEENNTIKSFVESMAKNDAAIKKANGETKGVEDNIKLVEGIIEANDFWTRLLKDLNTRMPTYGWIQALRPFDPAKDVQAQGAPFDMRGPPTGAPATGGGGDDYVIEGKGVTDRNNAQADLRRNAAKVVTEFQQSLEESPFIEKVTEKSADKTVEKAKLQVLDVQNPKEGEYIFSFKIKVTLKKPSVL